MGVVAQPIGHALVWKGELMRFPVSLTCLVFLGCLSAAAVEPVPNNTEVEFFEKLYGVEIKGVKGFEEYGDPDTFYSEIAKQVGIPELAYAAVKKEYGWDQDDADYFLAAMVKGGGKSPDWGVMISRIPAAIKTAATKEEKMKLLKQMELKMVVIGYDGTVSFPKEKKVAAKPDENN
jgi:hypothetical protein